MKPRVVVIGAGAAGLMAAAEAARRGAEVILLEKSVKTGVKILMSGGTRCNLTHHTNAQGITAQFGHARRFLQPSVGAFPPSALVAMFNRGGLATKVESTGKVFPYSNRAVDVRDLLHRRAVDAGVRIHCATAVTGIVDSSSGWAVQTATESIAADRLIVTVGGQSYPGCGTTGDGYAWLTELGHSLVTPRPALVPLVGGRPWTHQLSGLTLDDVQLTVKQAGVKKPIACRQGSLLLTHFGLSGPVAMDVSGAITRLDSIHQVRLTVDWLPQVTPEQLQRRLGDRDRDGGRRKLSRLLGEWLPGRLVAALLDQTGGDCRLAELSRRQTLGLVELLKRSPLPISGTRGFSKAEVTAGGVALDEVDPHTMASRRAPGLFIAGELLDVDGPIGGYNFQAAFSTGRAAGIAATS